MGTNTRRHTPARLTASYLGVVRSCTAHNLTEAVLTSLQSLLHTLMSHTQSMSLVLPPFSHTGTMVSYFSLSHNGLPLHTHVNTLRSLSHKPRSPPLSLLGDSHALQSLPHTTLQQPHSLERRGSRGLSVPTLQTQGNAPRGPLGSVVGRGTASRPGSGRLTSPAWPSGSDSLPPKRTTGSARKPAVLNLRTPGVDSRVLSAQAPNFPWKAEPDARAGAGRGSEGRVLSCEREEEA